MTESARHEMSTDHSLELAASIVRNRYHVLRIASVSRDVVHYDAQDVRSGRPVRLEFIRDAFAGDREFVAAVREQAATLAKLTYLSRSLAQVYECDTTDTGGLFVALEHVEGRTLREMLDGGALEPSTALRIANQVGEAIETLHHSGIVHGELSASSIVMVKSSDGRENAKIVAVELTAAHRTPIGVWLRAGSLAGLAPEQQYGEPTKASDIYALGKLLQQMVTARSKTDAIDSRSRPALVPLVVQTIITKALHWRQHDRYPNIRAMLWDIGSAHTALWLHSRSTNEHASFIRQRFSSMASFSSVGIRSGLVYGAVIAAVVGLVTLSGRVVSQFRVPVPAAALTAAPEASPSTTPGADLRGDYRIPPLPPAANAPVSALLEEPARPPHTSLPKAPVESIPFVPPSTDPTLLPQPPSAAPAFRDHRDGAVDRPSPTERARTVAESAPVIGPAARPVAQPRIPNERTTRRSNSDQHAGDGSSAIDWLLNQRR